jgi:multisubunit Na+/H+ antiporter MnhG subunit
MFTFKEKMLLIIGTIFFILATIGVYYFSRSFNEDLSFKSSKQELDL